MRAVPPFPAFSSLAHIFLILKAIAKKAKSIVTLSSPLCLNRRYAMLYYLSKHSFRFYTPPASMLDTFL